MFDKKPANIYEVCHLVSKEKDYKLGKVISKGKFLPDKAWLKGSLIDTVQKG